MYDILCSKYGKFEKLANSSTLWTGTLNNDDSRTISESFAEYHLSNFPPRDISIHWHRIQSISNRLLFQFFAPISLIYVESASEKGTLGMQQSCVATFLNLRKLYLVEARADRGPEAGASGGVRTVRQWQNWINRHAWTQSFDESSWIRREETRYHKACSW